MSTEDPIFQIFLPHPSLVPFQKLGTVTTGDLNVDNEDWGKINEWNKKYNEAIGNYFKNYLPE